MSTEIKYTNWFNQPITQQQLGMMDNYKKETIIDGFLKIEEFYNIKFSSKMITYFLDPNEDKNAIISQYSNPSEKTSCMIYENRQVVNGFTVWDWEDYKSDGTIAFKGKDVFDSQNRMIMNCIFNLITGELDGLTKTFYDDTNSLGYENLVFIFRYRINPDPEYGAFTVSDKNQSINEFFSSTEDDFVQWLPIFFTKHPYFKEINPLVPTSDVI